MHGDAVFVWFTGPRVRFHKKKLLYTFQKTYIFCYPILSRAPETVFMILGQYSSRSRIEGHRITIKNTETKRNETNKNKVKKWPKRNEVHKQVLKKWRLFVDTKAHGLNHSSFLHFWRKRRNLSHIVLPDMELRRT